MTFLRHPYSEQLKFYLIYTTEQLMIKGMLKGSAVAAWW